MMQRRIYLLALLGLGIVISSASAVITTPTPLKLPIEREQFIFVAKVKEVLPEKPALILTHGEDIKGKAPFSRIAFSLVGNEEAKKGNHGTILLERVEVDLPIIVFASKTRKGDRYVAMAFTNGTWFSLEGRIEKEADKEVVRWAFQSAEPYLRRTFKGTTGELKQIISDALAKKKEPPEWNEKEEPGFGPPLKKKTMSLPANGPLFAVIQLPFLGLIAALAALFPAVFGGLALLMRRWVALLSMISLFGILFALNIFFPRMMSGTWLGSEHGIWLSCGIGAGLGAIWSTFRYRRAIAEGRTEEYQPNRLDRVVMLVTLVLLLSGLGYALIQGEPLLRSPWLEALLTLTPLVAGLSYILSLYKRGPHPAPFSGETVMLWALTGACLCAGALEAGRRPTGEGLSQTTTEAGSLSSSGVPVVEPKPLWVFSPDENGAVLSSPCLAGDLVVVGVQHQGTFKQHGRIYGVKLATGEKVWEFDDDEKLKAIFCSPVLADGKIYIGEGFHQDTSSRMFCLEAATGKKLWEFATTSHTESTPAVAEGKVVFGAGNDGIYCLDAATGKELWRYTSEKGIHVDAWPVIYRGKVFAGSGLSRTHQVNKIFCLDLNTGKEIWGERVEDSAYGSPVAKGNQVFFGVGNGNFGVDRDPIRGAVLCREIGDGKEVWTAALPNSVVCRTAVDGQQVYVGCRDGFTYALDRKTGKVVWKRNMFAPVVSTPVIDGWPGITQTIYTAGQKGRFAALSPITGEPYWNLDIQIMTQAREAELVSTPLIVRQVLGESVKRKIIFGVGINPPGSIPKLYCFEDETKLEE